MHDCFITPLITEVCPVHMSSVERKICKMTINKSHYVEAHVANPCLETVLNWFFQNQDEWRSYRIEMFYNPCQVFFIFVCMISHTHTHTHTHVLHKKAKQRLYPLGTLFKIKMSHWVFFCLLYHKCMCYVFLPRLFYPCLLNLSCLF